MLALRSVALAQSPEIEFNGYLESETRYFVENPQFADQDDRRVEPSFAAQPELRLFWDRERLTIVPFARYDPADNEGRTHWDFREANLYVERDYWDATIGLGKVFWGVTESRHLVDIVNQTDLVESPDGEEKLGQPMVNVNLLTDWGTIGGFILPGFRERTFPGDQARFRGGLPIADDDAIFESGAAEKHVDYALRYSTSIGDWDIGLAQFFGTGREPDFRVSTNTAGDTVAVPVYDQIDQTSIDIQSTFDAWLLKLEAIRRGGQGDSFYASTAGFEYTIFGINESAADLGLLLEYSYDGRSDGAPGTFFDSDWFFGARYALNDEQSTELLVGAIVDQSSQETAWFVEAERRLGDGWKAELEGRFFNNVQSDSRLAAIRDDGNLLLRLAWYY